MQRSILIAARLCGYAAASESQLTFRHGRASVAAIHVFLLRSA